MITKPEWTPARVCILGWSRSQRQYFRFEQEPESTSRSVQELIKIFKGPNFCNYACCCQTDWKSLRRVFWPVSSYITKVWQWLGVPSISPLMMVSKLCPMQNRPAVCKWQYSAGIPDPCRNYENVGLMMWAIPQDTWQKIMVSKTDYREVTVCRNDLYTVGVVTGFDDNVRSNVQ